MSFLELKNVGKIYTSKDNVCVGIRGVNLSFDKGEFVVITGSSGSGKTTLLNSISGIDSYEEGELFIEEKPTSCFDDRNWEDYINRYISFVFQEYNIIDSFTVLDNVEAALTNITDKKERRQKAKEIIEKVGMTSHMKQRGSHLSGGQKQRTVIARALAKNSPIILADEPTGNLDSESSAAIVSLLNEISKDKLVIVVTHNYEEFEDYATRVIKIDDGTVVSDEKIRKDVNLDVSKSDENTADNDEKNNTLKRQDNKSFVEGIRLGLKILVSKPLTSMYYFFLLLIVSTCLYLFCGIMGHEAILFKADDGKLFNEQDGRLIVSKRDNSAFSDEEVEKLAKEYGADSFIHCDRINELHSKRDWFEYINSIDFHDEFDPEEDIPFCIEKDKDYGRADIGRYPSDDGECFLYLPYSASEVYGKESIRIKEINQLNVQFKVVGIKYFSNNTIRGKMVVTNNAYDILTALAYKNEQLRLCKECDTDVSDVKDYTAVMYSFDVKPDEIQILKSKLDKYSDDDKGCVLRWENDLDNTEKGSDSYVVSFAKEKMIPIDYIDSEYMFAIVNPDVVKDELFKNIDENYAQCSLYFSSDKKCDEAMAKIRKAGYVPFKSDVACSKYEGDFADTFFSESVIVLIWFALVLFLGFIFALSTKNDIASYSHDIGILRSLGISKKVISIAMYVRITILAVISFAIVITLALVAYTNVTFNKMIIYLMPDRYIIMFCSIMLMAFIVTKRHIAILSKSTVREAIKEGRNL